MNEGVWCRLPMVGGGMLSVPLRNIDAIEDTGDAQCFIHTKTGQWLINTTSRKILDLMAGGLAGQSKDDEEGDDGLS